MNFENLGNQFIELNFQLCTICSNCYTLDLSELFWIFNYFGSLFDRVDSTGVIVVYVFINFTSLLILFQIFEKSLSFSTVHYCLSFYLQNPVSNMAELRLTKPAPEFKGQAVVDGEFKDISLANYKGKYLVLFFYPLDL